MQAVGDVERFKDLLPSAINTSDAVSALVRPCLRAAPGKMLCMGDFASIEARGVAWCADEQQQLDLFAQGADLYCDLASKLFGYEVTKKHKRERSVGKEAVLGCGYSMGAEKFAARCAAQGIDLAASNTSAKDVVEGYREAYPAIAGTKTLSNGHMWRQGGLWRNVEAAARRAICTGQTTSVGRCDFCREGTSLVIVLPSGRRLFYRNARVEDVVPAYCQQLGLPPRPKATIVFDGPKMLNTPTYGGKLVENMVQAICRDLLAAAIVQCERRGLPVVLHIHDEIVIEVPADDSQAALDRLVTSMSAPPEWAHGFPIEVEAFAADRYFKSAPEGARQVRARNGQLV
jgi:DNA polymerase